MAVGVDTFHAGLVAPRPLRRKLAQDLDCEACVIGGGFAGLWTARALAKRGFEVVVIEAGRVGSGASGRNAGFVGPGYAERLDGLIARVGFEHARELWALSRDGVELVRAAVHGGRIGGAEPVSGHLVVRRKDEERAAHREADRLRRQFDTPVDVWRTREVRGVLHSPHYFQALHFPEAFHINPLALAFGLAEELERAGGRIFEETEALRADLNGVRKHVATSGGRIRAKHVVLASGVPSGRVWPAVTRGVIPVSTFIGVTEPLGEKLDAAVQFPGAVSDMRRAGHYFRRIAGDRLLFGSGITTRRSVPGGLAGTLAREIGDTFPDLAGAKVEHAWAGTMAYAVHRMPQIGQIKPGVWLAAAFGGHGLNTSAIAGELIASAITEADERWKLFAPFGVVRIGGPLGRIGVQASYWNMRFRDRMEERRARSAAAHRTPVRGEPAT
jgi:glycine/D-amino acid oxidase-like deaminating enzyme